MGVSKELSVTKPSVVPVNGDIAIIRLGTKLNVFNVGVAYAFLFIAFLFYGKRPVEGRALKNTTSLRNCFEMVEEFDYRKFFLYFGPGMMERNCSYVTE